MTGFGFALLAPEPLRPVVGGIGSIDELDELNQLDEVDAGTGSGADYWLLALYGCRLLDEAGFTFRIGGFGHPEWSFDVGYDLSTFMEELPGLIGLLEQGEGQAEIDLYGQGVERTLVFEADGELVRIEAVSRTDWRPEPAVEVLGLAELRLMVRELTRAFASGLAAVDPEFAAREPFEGWRTAGA